MNFSIFTMVCVLVMALSLVYVLYLMKYKSVDIFSEDDELTTKLAVSTILALVLNIVIHYYGYQAEREEVEMMLLLSGVLWFLGVFINFIILSCMFTHYNEYKRDCLALGVDTKEHIGKFIVTTRNNDWRKDKESKWQLDIKRITSRSTVLGELPEIITVCNRYATLTDQECSKENITELATKYFKDRKEFRHNYLVEMTDTTTLVESEDKPVEILII